MDHNLYCSDCAKIYNPYSPIWRCEECSGLLNIGMKPSFPTALIRKRKPTLWRYREALPIYKDKNKVSFNEGFTPLLKEDFGFGKALIKAEHLFPTGSYKDRGSTILLSHCKELNLKHVVEDSSGNAGASVAAYAAAAGIRCDIYAPAATSASKLTQIRAYGAKLFPIKGSRQKTAQAVMNAAEHFYYAGHSWNPYFFQGTKTFAFEVWEQLNEKSPDIVVLPAGNGTLLIGAFLGFRELIRAGLSDKMPELVAVQAENCNPLSRAYYKKKKSRIKKTSAEGIAVEKPVRARQILSMVEKSGGIFIDVSEAEIHDALKRCFARGHFIEPTSAATIAGLIKLQQNYEVGQKTVVSLFSGHGLKAADKISELL